MRQVCGLDVHKDTIFACIMDTSGVIFQEKFGTLTAASMATPPPHDLSSCLLVIAEIVSYSSASPDVCRCCCGCQCNSW